MKLNLNSKEEIGAVAMALHVCAFVMEEKEVYGNEKTEHVSKVIQRLIDRIEYQLSRGR